MYLIVGLDDDDDALWMDSMGIIQDRTTIMYPYIVNKVLGYLTFLSVIVDLHWRAVSWTIGLVH